MTQLARRASLVGVLLQLVSVGTASAECAWVLWQRETFTTFSQTPVDVSVREKSWELVRALPTYEACEATQAKTIKNISTAWKKPGIAVDVVGPVISIQTHDTNGNIGTAERQEFKCLPDTIDPRGP